MSRFRALWKESLVAPTRPPLACGAQPVSYVLGWVNATEKPLQKYANLFHSLGYPTVLRGTAPAFDAFFRHDRMVALAADLLDELADGRPATLVYFSNGGAFIHEKMMNLLRADAARPLADRRYARINIKAFVFDSAPAWLSVTAARRAISEHIRNPLLRRLVSWLAVIPIVSLVIPRGINMAQRYFDALAANDVLTDVPCFYIYSEADRITEAAKLDTFIAKRAAAGHPVSAWRITAAEGPRSGHVSHYPAAPAAYTAKLAAFLESVGACAPAPAAGNEESKGDAAAAPSPAA